MNSSNRFKFTLRYIYAHWPGYLALYAGIILALLIIGISAIGGLPAFIPLALALLLLLGYFTLASLWAAHKLYGREGLRPHHILFDMAQTETNDIFAYIDLGIRYQAIELGRRLTTGQIVVIDIYNPQWMTGRDLVRWRNRMPTPSADPRFEWCTGTISLLPLPDQSVGIVMLNQILSNFWQRGDQLLLLKEIYRVLAPNGRVLLAERARTQVNALVTGPQVLRMPTVKQWRALLVEAGFQVQTERDLAGIIHCFRVNKPTPEEARQLALDLDF